MATCLICGKDAGDDISSHLEMFHKDLLPQTGLRPFLKGFLPFLKSLLPVSVLTEPRPFLKGFLPVSVPVGALALLSTLGDVNTANTVDAVWLWFVGALLWLVGILATPIWLLSSSFQTTRAGILAGLVVAFLLLGGTCLSNESEYQDEPLFFGTGWTVMGLHHLPIVGAPNHLQGSLLL